MIKYILTIALFITGCVSNRQEVHTNITRTAKNFDKQKAICVKITEKQKNDLELETYKSYIETYLKRNGYKIGENNCEYTLQMQYSIWSGEKQINTPIMMMGNMGGFYNTPMPQVSGVHSRKETFYTRKINVDIFDKKGAKVFQANAISDGSRAQFLPISQCVMKAIFKGINSDKMSYSEHYDDICELVQYEKK